jgi:hypothetical protein
MVGGPYYHYAGGANIPIPPTLPLIFSFHMAGTTLAALAALVITSTWLGVSDWRSRTVGRRAILACYVVAIAVNALAVTTAATQQQAGDAAGAVDRLIRSPIPATAIIIALLSGTVIASWRRGLLASGDAYAIPALLSMLLFVATPAAVAIYFIAAMAITLVASITKNVYNNMRHKDKLYGSILHKLHLLLFCYYGSGSDAPYAFVYNNDSDNKKYDSGDGGGRQQQEEEQQQQQRQDGSNGGGDGCAGSGSGGGMDGNAVTKVGTGTGTGTGTIRLRRDYDGEPFYGGQEKIWLMPGLPLLSGFAPATVFLFLFLLLHLHLLLPGIAP